MNQRGEYGSRKIAPETRSALANHGVLALGLLVGAIGWPLYKRNQPLGVIALGASGSMVSAAILGLALGRSAAPADS